MAADVLVDTSIWIDFFRDPELIASRTLAALLDDDRVRITGPVITELFRGCRNQKESRRLRELLEPVPRVAVDDRVWDDAGDLGYALARKGITAFSIDLLIACIALRHDLQVFSRDCHFEQFARHSTLRVYRST